MTDVVVSQSYIETINAGPPPVDVAQSYLEVITDIENATIVVAQSHKEVISGNIHQIIKVYQSYTEALVSTNLKQIIIPVGEVPVTNLIMIPYQQFIDANGAPYQSGQIGTYIPGTLTMTPTYKDYTGTLNTNPIVLDDRGGCSVFCAGEVRFILTDVNGSQIFDVVATDNFTTAINATAASLNNTINAFSNDLNSRLTTGLANLSYSLIADINQETTRAQNAEALLAPKASPQLTGTPTAPTAANGTNNTQIANMAAVNNALYIYNSNLIPLYSFGQTGYQYIGGVLHQWGVGSATGNTNFPYTFPNECWNVQLTLLSNLLNSTIRCTGFNQTGISVLIEDTKQNVKYGYNFFYYATGY